MTSQTESPLDAAIRTTLDDIATAGMLQGAAQLAAVLPLQTHLDTLLMHKAELLVRQQYMAPEAPLEPPTGKGVPLWPVGEEVALSAIPIVEVDYLLRVLEEHERRQLVRPNPSSDHARVVARLRSMRP